MIRHSPVIVCFRINALQHARDAELPSSSFYITLACCSSRTSMHHMASAQHEYINSTLCFNSSNTFSAVTSYPLMYLGLTTTAAVQQV